MKIKKLVLLMTVIVGMALTLSSCSIIYRPKLLTRNDKTYGEARLQKIIESIEKKDKDELKKMFSPNALKEAKDLDAGIEYIMDFYKGKFKSKEGSYEASEHKGNGKRTIELKYFYRVTTDEDEYIVFFIDRYVDDPDNEGLYMLQIIKKSDREKEFDWGDKTKCAGIYRPKEPAKNNL